jgi:hypothetical protein
LAGNFGGKFWREILAGNFGGKLWREILAIIPAFVLAKNDFCGFRQRNFLPGLLIPWLPDGTRFSYQKSHFGNTLGMESFGIFYGHFEYIITISNILRPFGILYHQKSGNPDLYR